MTDEVQGRIERELSKQGVTASEWREGEDGLEAVLGRWRVIEDDEDRGLFGGDEGIVTACVVGSPEYGNQRVIFTFTAEGYDGGDEVRLFEDVDAV